MSQIYKSVSSAPSVPTSFVTDSGTATPAADILNVVTPGSGTQGIMTSGAGSTITITLTDTMMTGTAQTIGATNANLTPVIALATSNSVANIRANIAGYAKTAGLALGGEIIGAVRNVGGVLTILQTSDLTQNNDSLLSPWTASFSLSGTNIQVQVTGVATYTINWTGVIDVVIATEAQA